MRLEALKGLGYSLLRAVGAQRPPSFDLRHMSFSGGTLCWQHSAEQLSAAPVWQQCSRPLLQLPLPLRGACMGGMPALLSPVRTAAGNALALRTDSRMSAASFFHRRLPTPWSSAQPDLGCSSYATFAGARSRRRALERAGKGKPVSGGARGPAARGRGRPAGAKPAFGQRSADSAPTGQRGRQSSGRSLDRPSRGRGRTGFGSRAGFAERGARAAAATGGRTSGGYSAGDRQWDNSRSGGASDAGGSYSQRGSSRGGGRGGGGGARGSGRRGDGRPAYGSGREERSGSYESSYGGGSSRSGAGRYEASRGQRSQDSSRSGGGYGAGREVWREGSGDGSDAGRSRPQYGYSGGADAGRGRGGGYGAGRSRNADGGGGGAWLLCLLTSYHHRQHMITASV